LKNAYTTLDNCDVDDTVAIFVNANGQIRSAAEIGKNEQGYTAYRATVVAKPTTNYGDNILAGITWDIPHGWFWGRSETIDRSFESYGIVAKRGEYNISKRNNAFRSYFWFWHSTSVMLIKNPPLTRRIKDSQYILATDILRKLKHCGF
jgi:hypothetical protein